MEWIRHQDGKARGEWLCLAAALLCAGVMWGYVQTVLIPHQQSEMARMGRPQGNLSDLYPRWYGAKVLLREGRDPYGADVTREIQVGYYGRELTAGDSAEVAHAADPSEQQAFAYPLYVSFLLAPFVDTPFSVVEEWYRGLCVAMLLISVAAWRGVLGWPRSLAPAAAVTVLTLGSFAFIQGYKLQQLTVLVFALVSVSLWLLVKEQYFASGGLLALATIKPQLLVLLVAVLLVWVGADWRRRKSWLWGFAAVMLLLLAGSEVLLPGWLPEWLRALAAYRRYTGAVSPAESWLGPGLGMALNVAVWLAVLGPAAYGMVKQRLLPECRRDVRFWMASSLWLAVVGSAGAAAYNHLLLLPMLWWLLSASGLTVGRGRRRVSWVMLGVLGSPWLLAGCLVGARVLGAGVGADRWWFVPLVPVLLSPLLVGGLLAVGRDGRERKQTAKAVAM